MHNWKAMFERLVEKDSLICSSSADGDDLPIEISVEEIQIVLDRLEEDDTIKFNTIIYYLIEYGQCSFNDGNEMYIIEVKDFKKPKFSFKKTLCLCEGRHEMPSQVQGSIFPTEIDPFDYFQMRKTLYNKLDGTVELDLYVTGLTSALVEVINWCSREGTKLTLYHFDKNSGEYVQQEVYNSETEIM